MSWSLLLHSVIVCAPQCAHHEACKRRGLHWIFLLLHVYMQDAGCDDPTMPVLLAFHSWHVQSTVSAQLYVSTLVPEYV